MLHERNAIYMLQVLIALRGCDRSASFAAGHEFVDTSTWKGLESAGIIDRSPDVRQTSLDTHSFARFADGLSRLSEIPSARSRDTTAPCADLLVNETFR